jgi:hypothetical protein
MSDETKDIPDDVEGHTWRPRAADDQGEDVEGHTWRPRAADDDDDVEGHGGISRPQAVARPRAADDDEDDTEGHSRSR